jgi:hypothetical protein
MRLTDPDLLQQRRHIVRIRQQPPQPLPSETPLVEMNWKLVLAIAFGFFVWYVNVKL